MTGLFELASLAAVLSAFLTVTRKDAVHALMWLVVSLLALSVDFWLLGAPLVAALEVVVYAGAVLVLFVFVVMLLDAARAGDERAARRIAPGAWLGPALVSLALLGEIAYLASGDAPTPLAHRWVPPVEVGVAMYGPYALAVEAASFLLLAALVGAWHVGRDEPRKHR